MLKRKDFHSPASFVQTRGVKDNKGSKKCIKAVAVKDVRIEPTNLLFALFTPPIGQKLHLLNSQKKWGMSYVARCTKLTDLSYVGRCKIQSSKSLFTCCAAKMPFCPGKVLNILESL